MLTRRRLLTGLAALALGSRGRPASALAVRSVPATDFGAVSDGRTDATGALSLALNSGAIVDGRGGTFAVAGPLRAGPRFKGLVDAKLLLTAPRQEGGRGIEIQGADNFVVENVALLRSHDGTEPGGQKLILDIGALFLVGCRDFALRGVEVSGGGIGSAIAANQCTGFEADDLRVSDVSYRLPVHPTDDAVHGLLFVRCQGWTLRNAAVSRLGGTDGRTSGHDFNRGVAVSGSSDFRIHDLLLRDVGQGLDLTGARGNRDFLVRNSTVEGCVSWGFKFANSARDGRVERCRAVRAGFGAFVASGPAKLGLDATQRITVDGCTAEEVLGPDGRASFGFGIMAAHTIDPSYPRGILFRNCVARTRMAGHVMKFGFRNDVPEALTDGQPNRAVDCHAEGFTSAAFHGF